ncbi:hypothetical protein IWQ61_006940, partial [Dispira simplex]
MLDVAIQNGVEAAYDFFRARNFITVLSELGIYHDIPHMEEFLKSNFDKLNEESEEPFSLIISDIEFIRCQFNRETKKRDCQFPVTNEDCKNRNAWFELYEEFEKQQSQQA